MVMLQSGPKTKSVLVRDPSGFTDDKNGVHCESLMVVDGDVKKSVEQVDVRTLKKRVLQSGRKIKRSQCLCQIFLVLLVIRMGFITSL
jgi:hypothetical protein